MIKPRKCRSSRQRIPGRARDPARAGENAYFPGSRKKMEQQAANPQVSVYDFAEILTGKKAAERAAASGEEKPKEPEQPKRRGRPPKEDKDKAAAPKPKAPAQKKPEKAPKEKPEKKAAPTVQAAPAPKEPEGPKEAPRRGEEQIVYIKLNELYAFKNHPFEVRDDEEMRAMVSSVKDKGITQPAIVRPREDGGYEIVSGHRRQKASELAGYADMPCSIRSLKNSKKRPAITRSQIFLVEINGIEPLTF